MGLECTVCMHVVTPRTVASECQNLRMTDDSFQLYYSFLLNKKSSRKLRQCNTEIHYSAFSTRPKMEERDTTP